MTFKDVVAEWKGFREEQDNRDFAGIVERNAAKELIEAKKYLPGPYVEKSGLDAFDTESRLLEDVDRLIGIAVFFSFRYTAYNASMDDDGSLEYKLHFFKHRPFYCCLYHRL